MTTTKEYLHLNMGPAHPAMHGVIKIALTLDGETVVDSDIEIGYLHRAFEKTVEHRTWTQVIPYTDRLNYVSPLINNVGYVMAVERLLGLETTPRCRHIRVMVSEISRITDHLTCIGASAMELGALTVFLYMIKAREELWHVVEALTGARLTTTYTRVGGLAHDLTPDFESTVRKAFTTTRRVIEETHGLLTHNRIFIDRMKGTGVVSAAEALSYGFTGPCLRASGVSYDVRKARPYLVYDKLDFTVPLGQGGDNFDRYLVRMQEMEQSMRIVEQCLDGLPSGPVNVDDPRIILPEKEKVYTEMEALIAHFKLLMPGHGIRPPAGEVYLAVEGASGELGFYVVSDGTDRPYRVRVRPPCFFMMAGLHKMINGYGVADIVPTFGSVNMIAGELDR